MSRVPSKHGRDQAPVHQQYEGMLNNLQDWELSLKEKDKKLKSQTIGKDKLDFPAQRRSMNNASQLSSTAKKYDHFRNYDTISNLSSSIMTEESSIDANSEKELGNEYFKQKNFNEAIDCYSRSIALSPTAVAYANRAMAYLKIKRFQEAEDDCTEALNLDDRYIKAYSRRSTARKELGKHKTSIEDAEFALRLEPHNQEIKKQYAEVKSLYDKEILKKASGALKGSMQGVQKAEQPNMEIDKHVQGSNSMSTMRVAEIQKDHTMGWWFMQWSTSNLIRRINRNGKQELKAPVQELAARAANLAMAEAAKNIIPPNSAYQFEASWRGLSSDCALQARLLKTTSPSALPQIFKNALSAAILIDILRCIATFFTEERDLAVEYLDNLTKVPRFDMIIMCLSSIDKADLLKMWDEVFCNEATPEYTRKMLSKLRSRYCFKQ